MVGLNTYGAASDPYAGKGETMLGHDLIVAPTQDRPAAIIDGSGRKARDRIEHFLRAAIDNDNTRRAYGRALGSFSRAIERSREGPPLPGHQTSTPYGRGQAELTGERFHRISAWKMVQRRAKAAGITTEVCNHTFRGTGITAYLENCGTLEKARQMAAHASTRTTQLYDRREDRVTLDEVVKINIRG
jgi:hypothetical protein